AQLWPGVSSLVAQLLDKTERIRRLHWFFAKDGSMPEWVELRFGRPPGFEHLSHEEWAEKIRKAIAGEEEKAAEQRNTTGMPVLGVRTIKAQSPFATPATREKRFRLKPRVACRNKWASFSALRCNKDFEGAYRAAFSRRRRGDV